MADNYLIIAEIQYPSTLHATISFAVTSHAFFQISKQNFHKNSGVFRLITRCHVITNVRQKNVPGILKN
nr:unnamed protein product [Callosobruchus chinensis]